jgi:hypothetical protein
VGPAGVGGGLNARQAAGVVEATGYFLADRTLGVRAVPTITSHLPAVDHHTSIIICAKPRAQIPFALLKPVGGGRFQKYVCLVTRYFPIRVHIKPGAGGTFANWAVQELETGWLDAIDTDMQHFTAGFITRSAVS